MWLLYSGFNDGDTDIVDMVVGMTKANVGGITSVVEAAVATNLICKMCHAKYEAECTILQTWTTIR
ncbi:MAG: hypothetical protein NW224_26930 [Leptolyngbyaceae cyanobacterium bins.302]|nr:hypothetical protein [Leptolyngbyaceae cyanobacterium bins.302]